MSVQAIPWPLHTSLRQSTLQHWPTLKGPCVLAALVILLSNSSCSAVRRQPDGTVNATKKERQEPLQGNLMQFASMSNVSMSSRSMPCAVRKHVMLVHHGESVDDIIKHEHPAEIRNFFTNRTQEAATRYGAELERLGAVGWSTLRDSPLSLRGTDEMRAIGQMLFGPDRDVDLYSIFSDPNPFFKRILVSPLRRAQGTAFEIFGRIAKIKKIPFIAMPWAHARRNSWNDVGETATILASYANSYGDSLGIKPDEEPLKSFLESFAQLQLRCNEWATDPTCPDKNLPFYPVVENLVQEFGRTEPQNAEEFQQQLERLETELCHGPTGEHGIVLVTHSGVCAEKATRELVPWDFEPANGAIFVVQLPGADGQPAKAQFGEDFLTHLSGKAGPLLPRLQPVMRRSKHVFVVMTTLVLTFAVVMIVFILIMYHVLLSTNEFDQRLRWSPWHRSSHASFAQEQQHATAESTPSEMVSEAAIWASGSGAAGGAASL
eukprot:TRINITY_DN45432_c0_g1_i1.p1 TRINITY_DN45432_c0_g1~~TRINITY_DN45432_c0_g1_i1.p1  ORF type:complete len:491 (-),score=66.92 TRINITY_DN45432_c0_g1_i1:124-1596(-)